MSDPTPPNVSPENAECYVGSTNSAESLIACDGAWMKKGRDSLTEQPPSSLQVIALTSTLNTCKDQLTELLDELSEDELQGMSASANFVDTQINSRLKSFEEARQAKIKEAEDAKEAEIIIGDLVSDDNVFLHSYF